MHAEMLSYSRSRGIFAGLTLEGATLRPDKDANREIYGKDMTNKEILTGTVQNPAAAARETVKHGDQSRIRTVRSC